MPVTALKTKPKAKPPVKKFATLPKRAKVTIRQAKIAIDRMGVLDAQMAPLKVSREFNRETVIEFSGGKDCSVDGKQYRGTVVYSYPQRYDTKKLKTFLTPRQLKACMLPTEECITVRVVSLKSVGKKK